MREGRGGAKPRAGCTYKSLEYKRVSGRTSSAPRATTSKRISSSRNKVLKVGGGRGAEEARRTDVATTSKRPGRG